MVCFRVFLIHKFWQYEITIVVVWQNPTWFLAKLGQYENEGYRQRQHLNPVKPKKWTRHWYFLLNRDNILWLD
jgi:hypothetical protein